MIHYNLLNGLTLAYVGDAYYELQVRKYLIDKGHTKVNELHKLAIKYVSATAQANIIGALMEQSMLTDEETDVVRRGRNAKANHKKSNTDVLTYKHSTSFESLIGYLYLMNQGERLNEIITYSISLIESGN